MKHYTIECLSTSAESRYFIIDKRKLKYLGTWTNIRPDLLLKCSKDSAEKLINLLPGDKETKRVVPYVEAFSILSKQRRKLIKT